MHSPREVGAARRDHALESRPPSAEVRLEVAILDAEQDGPTPAVASFKEPPRRTILVVSSEADLRREVREHFQGRTDVLLIEAENIATAIGLAERLQVEMGRLLGQERRR